MINIYKLIQCDNNVKNYKRKYIQKKSNEKTEISSDILRENND